MVLLPHGNIAIAESDVRATPLAEREDLKERLQVRDGAWLVMVLLEDDACVCSSGHSGHALALCYASVAVSVGEVEVWGCLGRACSACLVHACTSTHA